MLLRRMNAIMCGSRIYTVCSVPALEIASLLKKDFACKMLKTDMEQMFQQLSTSTCLRLEQSLLPASVSARLSQLQAVGIRLAAQQQPWQQEGQRRTALALHQPTQQGL
jgi:hypothetical protein